jgi:hypothetical protein
MSAEHDPAQGAGAPEHPAAAGGEESSGSPVDHEQWDEDGGSTGSAASEADTGPAASDTAAPEETRERVQSPNMLPAREGRRLGIERLFVRLVATCGVIGIGVAIAAVLAHNKTQGWIVGLVVSIVTVVLSAILWSSRQL